MNPNRRYFPLIISLLLAANMLHAQSIDWEWIKTFGGKNADEIYSTCIDKSGNIYLAGYFQGDIDIDGRQMKSNGDTDALIAKFDRFGNLCWAKQAGGNYSENLIITEYAKKIKVDNEGNIIVAGIFAWDATIDNTILKGAGNNDVFVIKYNPQGALIWAKNFGSFGHDYLFDMDIDGIGNIFISGILNGPLVMDGQKIEEVEDIPGSLTFIAKLSSKGNLSWLRRDQGAADNTFIAIEKTGFMYYGINYSSGISINDNFIKSEGSSDFLIQGINTKGETIWQKKYCSKFNDVLGSMSLSADNTLLISGKYANVSEFKLNSSSDTVNDQKTYFSSIRSDGSLSWSVNNSGPSFPRGTTLIGSPENTYFSTDVFQSEINIEDQILTPSTDWFNSYLAVHNSSGKVRRIELQLPGIITSVAPDNDNSIIVAGSCVNKFGISAHFNPSGGFIDFFIGKKKLSQSDNLILTRDNSEAVTDYIIFPNPTVNHCCTLDSKSIKKVDRINITDQEGKLLQYEDNCSLPYQMDLTYLSKGSYIVSIIRNAKISSKQLVVN